MRIKVLAARILSQLIHDKRTLALVIVAPIMIITILYLILDGTGGTYKVVAGAAPERVIESLIGNEDIKIEVVDPYGKEWTRDVVITDEKLLVEAIKELRATAAITVSDELDDIRIYIDGTNSTDASKVKSAFTLACQELGKERQSEILEKLPFNVEMKTVDVDYEYIYGSEDNSFFDTFGSTLVGIIVFFFVFLIAGINFLGERTSGTLEKMLSTPIKRYEIVFGYTLGYSILAVIQTVIITLFVVYVIGLSVQGSIWLVLLINVLTAICALTLGTLLSCLANSEFQMVQFIPIVIIPQIFLCGIFNLSNTWDVVGHFVPIYYCAASLQEVIIRGNGINEIWEEIIMLLLFSILFIILNIINLRKYRKY